MAVSLKHAFTSGKGDGLDTSKVQPSNWNAEHALTLDTNNLVGRSTAGNGVAEEVPCTSLARSFIAATTEAAMRTVLGLGSLATLSSLAFSAITSKPTTLSGYGITDAAAKAGQTFDDPIFIETPEDKEYLVILNRPFAGTITKVTTKCESGTCTVTTKIGATALGGTANSASSSQQEQAHASDNEFSAGDDISVTVSSNSTCVGLAINIEYTRSLA